MRKTRQTPIARRSGRRGPGAPDAGFTLVELLVALTITTVILGAAVIAASNARRANDAAALVLEMNAALRSGTDIMVRDLIQVGQGLPSGKVIEKPNGTSAAAINRPGPPASNLTFGLADSVFTAVTTGAGLGPAYSEPVLGGGTITGPSSDIITLLYVDSQYDGISCSIQPTGRLVTVTPPSGPGGADISGPGVLDPMAPGDLVLITGSTAATGSALMLATAVNGQVISFDAGDGMSLNQTAASDGTIMQLLPNPAVATGAVFSRVRMVTYFVDNTVDPPRLMRQINYNAPRTVAVGVDNLQISYDIADGITNPTNVKSPAAPNQIRKVNLYLSARSTRRAQTAQFLRNSLATQVALRSLAFVDRYQ